VVLTGFDPGTLRLRFGCSMTAGVSAESAAGGAGAALFATAFLAEGFAARFVGASGLVVVSFFPIDRFSSCGCPEWAAHRGGKRLRLMIEQQSLRRKLENVMTSGY
jgi:hypothetical protein